MKKDSLNFLLLCIVYCVARARSEQFQSWAAGEGCISPKTEIGFPHDPHIQFFVTPHTFITATIVISNTTVMTPQLVFKVTSSHSSLKTLKIIIKIIVIIFVIICCHKTGIRIVTEPPQKSVFFLNWC